MNKLPTQKELILKHLKCYGGITDEQARERYGIHRLSGRIYELRHDLGLVIENEHKICKNRYGKKVRYDRYVLKYFPDKLEKA